LLSLSSTSKRSALPSSAHLAFRAGERLGGRVRAAQVGPPLPAGVGGLWRFLLKNTNTRREAFLLFF